MQTHRHPSLCTLSTLALVLVLGSHVALAKPGNGNGPGKGGGGSPGSGGSTPPYLSFVASSDEVSAGESVVLSWASTNTRHCFASGDWDGKLNTEGFYTTPALDTSKSYTLECKNGGDTVTATVAVAVTAPNPAPQPAPDPTPQPTLSLTAAASAVSSGGSTTLSWTATDADSCSASGGWSGTRALSGSETAGPIDSATTYALSCTGAGGSVSDSVTVDVNSPAPTLALSAAASAVSSGGSTTLSWTATDADSCSASGGWSGTRALSGSETAGPIETATTYALSCTGAGGSVSDSVTVAVATQPTVELSAADRVVPAGATTELSWTSAAADSCTAGGGWSGAKGLSGSETAGPIDTATTYTLSCTGAGGSAMAMIAVSVNDTVTLEWQAPTENVDGSPLTDLDAYHIHYGPISGSYTDMIEIGTAGSSHSLVLSSGTYYFAMTAVDTAGNESAYSNEVVKVVD